MMRSAFRSCRAACFTSLSTDCVLSWAARSSAGGTTPIPRFVQAFDRARAISEALFKDSKKLSVVVSYYGAKRRGRREREALADLRTLGFAPFSFGHPERTAEGDQDHIQTYGQDINRYCHCLELPSYFPDAETLLWGCISAESPIKPKGGSALIYLIDFERRVILHVYDDRGMDIVAMTPEPLLPLYERFTDWLLDHDRSKMDKAFGG